MANPRIVISPADRHLVLICHSHLLLAWTVGDPGDEFVADSLRYRSIIDSDFAAFYDRILDQESRLIGIEIFLLANGEELVDRLLSLPYSRPGRATLAVQIYFGDPPTSAPVVKLDQEFGGRIYEAVTGAIAIAISTCWLSESERDSICAANVEWTSLE